jgi:hypothetical protein
MTAACGCEKFPLKKGGSAERREGCVAPPDVLKKGLLRFALQPLRRLCDSREVFLRLHLRRYPL